MVLKNIHCETGYGSQHQSSVSSVRSGCSTPNSTSESSIRCGSECDTACTVNSVGICSSSDNSLLTTSINSTQSECDNSCNEEGGVQRKNSFFQSSPSDAIEGASVFIAADGYLRHKSNGQRVDLSSLKCPNVDAGLIIDAVIKHVQHRIITDLKYKAILVPSMAEALSPLARADILVSEKWQTADNLLLVINSSKGARPGLWSRTLCMDDGLDRGSMIQTLLLAAKHGYAVMILNPNLNSISIGGVKVPIEGNVTPEDHVEYCWNNFVSTAAARNIFIMGNGYGGVLAKNLLASKQNSIFTRLRAVALTESYHSLSSELSMNLAVKDTLPVRNFLAHHTINWQLSSKQEGVRLLTLEERKGCICISAGLDTKHANPAKTCVIFAERMFQFFECSKQRDFCSLQFAAIIDPTKGSYRLVGSGKKQCSSRRNTSVTTASSCSSFPAAIDDDRNVGPESPKLKISSPPSSNISSNANSSSISCLSPTSSVPSPTTVMWVPDDEVDECQVCMKSFNFLVRKHHCRACGKVICYECGKQRVLLSGKKTPVRGCYPCYILLTNSNNNGNSNTAALKVSPKGLHSLSLSSDSTHRRKVSTDDFDLLKVIGKGSFGKVLLVRRKVDMNIYALKILQKSTVVKRNQVEHTVTERKILQELHHPFISGLKFAFQTEGKLYLGMEFYSGGPLFYHLQHARRFNEARALFYVAEVVSGISYLHSRNIVYRDLKPENLLLDSQGHLVITDFGLSKLCVEEATKGATTVCGTPEYVAPELILGKPYGKAVDWWSVGTLLYELISGLPPFYDKNRKKMFNKILNSPLEFKHPVSYHAQHLIERLLDRDPMTRLGSKGPTEVTSHPFFSKIDWNKLERREISPPWTPEFSSEIDTCNFSSKYTRATCEDVACTDLVDSPVFERFTFENF